MQSNRSLVDICLITVAYHSHTFHTSIDYNMASFRDHSDLLKGSLIVRRLSIERALKELFVGHPIGLFFFW